VKEETMPAFVDSTVKDIDSRLRELKDEMSKLEAARAALAGTRQDGRGGAKRGPGRPRTTTQRAAAASGAPGATRRKAGARRTGGRRTRASQVLALVRRKPGITIPELAKEMKIHPNYLYRVLPGLATEGQVKRDGKGWHPAS
jgi:hypothetical protein